MDRSWNIGFGALWLRQITGIDRPTSGECRAQGFDVAQLNEPELADWRNQNVAFVFQTFNLIPVLTSQLR